MFTQDILTFASNNSSTILCLIATITYVYWFANKRPKNFPPGPVGFPVIGVAPYIGGRPEKTFQEWRKKYGDIMGFKMGKDYTVVLNNYELIQEALVKHGFVFNHRPNNFIMTDVMHKSGISMSDYAGHYIKERKFASISLSKLGFGKTVLENTIIDESRRFLEHFAQTDLQLDANNKRTLMNAAGNVICQVLLGKRYEYEDPEFQEIAEAYIEFFRKGSLAYQMTIILPWIHRVPPILNSAKAIISGMATIDRIMTEKIEEHEKTFDKNEMRDFMDEYLLEMKTKGNTENNLFTKKMLKCMGRDLFGAGMETIQISVLYSLIILANRPAVQKKMHEEIDQVVGAEGAIRFAMREKMIFCSAFIKEVLRFRTVGPLTIAHCTSKNVVFRGYNIPKGTTILPNLYAVHNDPEIWKDPDQFKPERHLDADGRLNVSKYLIPFSMGPRVCIGRRLAEVELFIFLISILQKFESHPTPTADCERPFVVEDVEQTGLVMGAPEHIPVTLRHR